jgi:hypothetical protein
MRSKAHAAFAARRIFRACWPIGKRPKGTQSTKGSGASIREILEVCALFDFQLTLSQIHHKVPRSNDAPLPASPGVLDFRDGGHPGSARPRA